MIKPIEIISAHPYSVICLFSSGETRELNVEPLLVAQKDIQGVNKLFDKEIFSQVAIGEVGQLLWKDIVTMKNEKGELISVEYDISPEFAYNQSTLV